MKSNYFNAESVVKAVLLKAETKKFDVKINLNGKTYLAGVTTRNGEELADSYDFSRLPKDLSDEQIEEITDKISETFDDFSMDKSKHIRDDQKEIDHFYKGLKFFDDTIKEYRQLSTNEHIEACKANLAKSIRDDIVNTVSDEDFGKFRYFFLKDVPTFEDMKDTVNQLIEYKQLKK
jgi:ribosomal protein S13